MLNQEREPYIRTGICEFEILVSFQSDILLIRPSLIATIINIFRVSLYNDFRYCDAAEFILNQ
jgi:hypothetical protein